MKRFFSLIFAGIIGGMFVLFGDYLVTPKNSNNFNNSSLQTKFVTNKFSNTLPLNFKAAAKKAMPSVVHIKTRSNQTSSNSQNDIFRNFFGDDFLGGSGPREGSGSGVIYSHDGYIITNNHVIDQADEVEVTLYDNRTFTATVIGKDNTTDLAVLKIEANRLPTLDNANSDHAEVGEWVLAVGNPFDLTSTVTAGIISSKARDINILKGRRSIESFIQTDAAVNPGNSGGALVDATGNLLGINSAIATQTGSFAGYSFAIPIEIVTKVVDDLIKYGETQRGLIGIDVQDLDTEIAKELDLDINQGIIIENVLDGTAGQYAGLLPYDVITEVDGRKVNSSAELQGLLGRKRPGDTVSLTIYRNKKIKIISVRLKAG